MGMQDVNRAYLSFKYSCFSLSGTFQTDNHPLTHKKGDYRMNKQITSEEVANQFARAIQLLLEWARQEMLAPSQPRTMKPILDRGLEGDQILPDSKRLLKAKEVADILQVSRSMAYRMMQRGEIPTIRVGSAVRERGSDLEEFIKKGKDS